jgi:hypothetical protein
MVMQDDVVQDDPDNLDSLIDDTARAMTSARIDDDLFVRRVSARIQDAQTAPAPRTWSRAWLLAPVAAAVVLLAVMIGQRKSTHVRLTPSAKATRVEKPAATPVTKPDATTATVRLKPDATPLTKPDAATVVASTTVGLKLDPAGQPDPDFQPLTTAPIEVKSLALSPLVVAMPIEISTIAIDRIEIAAMP